MPKVQWTTFSGKVQCTTLMLDSDLSDGIKSKSQKQRHGNLLFHVPTRWAIYGTFSEFMKQNKQRLKKQNYGWYIHSEWGTWTSEWDLETENNKKWEGKKYPPYSHLPDLHVFLIRSQTKHAVSLTTLQTSSLFTLYSDFKILCMSQYVGKR